jgi:hypothetical protein
LALEAAGFHSDPTEEVVHSSEVKLDRYNLIDGALTVDNSNGVWYLRAAADQRFELLEREYDETLLAQKRAEQLVLDRDKHCEQYYLERGEARALVLRLIAAQGRVGWEQGETEQEIVDHAFNQLHNWGLDPHNDVEACRALLEQHNPQADLELIRTREELLEETAEILRTTEQELGELNGKLDDLRMCIEGGHDYGSGPTADEICYRCGHRGPGDREHALRLGNEQLKAMCETWQKAYNELWQTARRQLDDFKKELGL